MSSSRICERICCAPPGRRERASGQSLGVTKGGLHSDRQRWVPMCSKFWVLVCRFGRRPRQSHQRLLALAHQLKTSTTDIVSFPAPCSRNVRHRSARVRYLDKNSAGLGTSTVGDSACDSPQRSPRCPCNAHTSVDATTSSVAHGTLKAKKHLPSAQFALL